MWVWDFQQFHCVLQYLMAASVLGDEKILCWEMKSARSERGFGSIG